MFVILTKLIPDRLRVSHAFQIYSPIDVIQFARGLQSDITAISNLSKNNMFVERQYDSFFSRYSKKTLVGNWNEERQAINAKDSPKVSTNVDDFQKYEKERYDQNYR